MKYFKAATAIGAISLGVTQSAWAQSSVTLYGSLDVGIAYVSNSGGSPKWIQEQGNMQPDRWGLVGNEDLGGGLKAVFRLENGFFTTNGNFSVPGTLWNRQAYVGLSSDRFGTLTLGHQTPFNFDWLGGYSTGRLAASFYAFHPGNIDQLADTGTVTFNNTVKFRSADYDGFSFGAMLGLGNTTNFSYGRTVSAGVNYTAGSLSAAAIYSNEHDQPMSISTMGLASFQGIPAAELASYTADKVETIGSGLSYQFGKLLVHALYTHVKLQMGSYSDMYQSYDAGANYQVTAANTVAGGASTTTLEGKRWTQFEIGDIYALSKSTQLYGNALYERGTGGANAALFTTGASSNANQVALMVGMHHLF
jgi:predicted porin